MPFTGIGVGLWANYTPDPNLVLDLGFSGANGVLHGDVVFNRDSVAYTLNDFILFEQVAIDEPRFPPDPYVDFSKGLLMEPEGTNILIRSEEVQAAGWSGTRLDPTEVNTAIAPDGEMSGDTIIANNTSGIHFLRQNRSKAAETIVYAGAVFIKQHTAGVTTPYAYITLYDGSSGEVGGRVNLVTGEVDQLIQTGAFVRLAFFVLPGPFGWWRVAVAGLSTTTLIIAFTVHIGNDGQATYVSSYTGDPAYNRILVWGAMLEAGTTFNSTYIETTTAAATREPETAIVDLTGLLGSVNTLLVSAHTYFATGRVLCQIDDGTEDNRIRIERDSGGDVHVIVTAGGVEQADLDLGAVAALSSFSVALRFGEDDFSASLNGGAVVADTSGTMPTVDTMRIGHDTTDSQWGSIIKDVKLWNVGRDDAFLILASS
jgi:hypothetical protein